jgi:hypothetical protein
LHRTLIQNYPLSASKRMPARSDRRLATNLQEREACTLIACEIWNEEKNRGEKHG